MIHIDFHTCFLIISQNFLIFLLLSLLSSFGLFLGNTYNSQVASSFLCPMYVIHFYFNMFISLFLHSKTGRALLIFLSYQSFDLFFNETSALYCLSHTLLFCCQMFPSFLLISALVPLPSPWFFLSLPQPHKVCAFLYPLWQHQVHDFYNLLLFLKMSSSRVGSFFETLEPYVPSCMLWCHLIGLMFGFFILIEAWHLPICGVWLVHIWPGAVQPL